MANENFLNNDAMLYLLQRLSAILAKQSDLTTTNTNLAALQSEVDDIVAQHGEPNVIETVKVNGTALTVTDKAVDVTVPTNNNQLTNGAGYQTASDVADAIKGKQDTLTFDSTPTKDSANPVKSGGVFSALALKAAIATTLAGYGITDAYTKEQVDSAIASAVADAGHITKKIVDSLPETGEDNVIYLVPNGETKTSANTYNEYMWIGGKWEKTGSTDIDLSGYWNSTNLTAMTNTQIDTVVNTVFGS